MKIEVSAPCNIALIKYMGKVDLANNLPSNPSLSYTLEHLRSFVTIEPSSLEDQWSPLVGLGSTLNLSAAGQSKFLNHFARLKEQWRIPGSYVVRSANNFPSDCGLASSASSFAALTLATAELARSMGLIPELAREELSRWSRRGSGSSCRSFFSPWAVWQGEGAEALDLPLILDHAVVLVEIGHKDVSSREAHQRVTGSALFDGRAARAEMRLKQLTLALRSGVWRQAFELCWSETWDMHALFETSPVSFGYMTEGSLAVLRSLRQIWRDTGDGPLVTMDAGANVHVFLRADQRPAAEQWLGNWRCLKSWG